MDEKGGLRVAPFNRHSQFVRSDEELCHKKYDGEQEAGSKKQEAGAEKHALKYLGC
ncbi:MAG: hypothetical protein ACLPRH_11300 [Syntrophobacteraceae bacterium]